MKSFGGKAVPGQVTAELINRARPSAYSAWFAGRSVWVKVVSRSSSCGQYKTLTSLKPINGYVGGGFTGTRPHPIITGVKVGTAGSLGTIKEATINMIAFTSDQLNELETCYLIPKMSVMVIFGWSALAGGGAVGSSVGGSTDVAVNCNIKDLSPGADGVQGRVAKYDVSFNKDGMWWEISLKIVGSGNAVVAAPAEDFTNTCDCETVSSPAAANSENAGGGGEGEKKKTAMSAFRQIFVHLCEYASKGDEGIEDVKSYGTQFGGGTYAAELNNKNRWKTSLMEDIGGFIGGLIPDWIKKGAQNLGADANPWSSIEAYISVGALCRAWTQYSTSQCAAGGLYGKFDNIVGGLTLPPGGVLQSSNPHKALFPSEDYPELDAPSCIDGDKCNVNNILVNAIFANQCLIDCGKQARLDDFMSKILQGINDAAGGLWELTIIDSGECGGTEPQFSIIDLQAIESVDAVTIPIDASSAVVREVSVALKMTDAMQTQALYAGVKQGTKDQSCDDTKFNKLLSSYKNEHDPTGCKPPVALDCSKHSKLGCTPSTSNGGGNDFGTKLKEMKEDTGNPDLMEACYTEQVKLNNGGGSGGSQCKNVILPYEFGFTVDGIGGFDFGQMVTSNVLPEATRAQFTYQVVAVEHDVTHGDWKTTVKTVPRYK